MLDFLDQIRPHHQELRLRLIRCFIALALCSALAYLVKDQIAAQCMQPLYLAYPNLGKLVYTRLPEAFVSYIKLALLTGTIVSSPYLLYQVWMFIAPGLLEHEKKVVRAIIGWATGLFAGGALFAFFVALPRMLIFFMHYASAHLIPKLNLGLYLGFVGRMILAFGIAFEIPFLIVMVVRTGLLPQEYFIKKRFWFYTAIAVLAFLLTGGEPVATLLLSLPLCALYELGILAVRFFPGKGGKRSEKPTS